MTATQAPTTPAATPHPAAPTDSPNPWVADHIRHFEETGGVPRPGIRDLLLTTRGRRSGVLRRTALAYVADGDSYVLTASNAGAGQHPAWYLNLSADPAVTLQVATESFPALARPATPAEAERLWPVVVAAMPSYAAYRGAAARTSGREIPLVLVTRTATRTATHTAA
ncbi:nitroreductase family deazaflavin-dependent oxidoreductase [Streptomyces sp. NBC_00335]|uniref:nitroreductase/quinone reductase family protein n=1 Tax=unclassified Streptomyces TaxID=2593676 RepID=UPI002253DA95|nr:MULTISPECIES: nitroreductase/quinone reductase family protein [unclassified Streptomyces]MCX5406540.1 nitroreductase family deazaflavin-dependent oxidoreductase [Streptomyces sp. NBC_00086]